MAADPIHELDYRFGWRWLLPIRDDDRLILSGFRESEEVFLRNALKLADRFTDSVADANVWIADSDQDGHGPATVARDCSRVDAICVVGSGRSVARWRKALSGRFPFQFEYGFLPADTPRLIVPLGSSQRTISALRLHHPGRRLAKLGMMLVRSLVSIGQFAPLRRRMLFVAVKDETRFPAGAIASGLETRFPVEKGAFALYLGTPDVKRKTVILPLMDPQKVLLKTASSTDARDALRSELSTLRALEFSSIGPNIPRVLDVVDNGDTLTLYQEYRQRKSTGNKGYRNAVIDFLSRLSAQGRDSCALTEILEKVRSENGVLFCDSEGRVRTSLIRKLEQAAEVGTKLWVNLSHGDFAPWNCSWTDEGLFVFDWEESREKIPAFGDAFYFVVAPAVHIPGKHSVEMITNDALGLAAEVAGKAGLTVDDLRIYWALWLIERAAIHDEPLYFQLLDELKRHWQIAAG